jgi:hypothetical protein
LEEEGYLSFIYNIFNEFNGIIGKIFFTRKFEKVLVGGGVLVIIPFPHIFLNKTANAFLTMKL